jgi:hypothetical protein
MNPEPDDIQLPSPDLPALNASDFQSAFGEPLEHALDLDTWRPATELAAMYERVQQEVSEAVRQETEMHRQIRERIFPLLKTRAGRPPGAGVFRTTIEQVETVHSKLLFNGGVEACDGTIATHDTLPVTITQIGVSLVSYSGDQGSWGHRLFRRDLRASGSSAIDETLELLERRRGRGAVDQPSKRDQLSDLARRGIMAFAERAVLLNKSDAVFRMGHGNPLAYELVTGSGSPQLCTMGVGLLRDLVRFGKFVYIPSGPKERELLTIGGALQPLEYAIVDSLKEKLERIAQGHYRGDHWGTAKSAVDELVKEAGDKVLIGVYRASHYAPPQVFYAHADHAHEAALIALADSVLQEHRGFPMLIDLADKVCTLMFGGRTFATSTQLAYADAGEPFRYMAERATRR